MSLPPVDSIEAGSSILFLGAGFSRAAKNKTGQPVVSGWALTNILLDRCAISDRSDYDLDTASQEFLQNHSEDDLIKILFENFDVGEISEDQKTIICQPWHRVYTTNYDNIVEKSGVAKTFVFRRPSDPVEATLHNVCQCINIYGSITRLTPSEFKNHFLLTERQRDRSPFLSTPWFRRFMDDVLSAKAVVFVGFSLNDIDLRRLLGSLPESSKQRIFFVDDSSCRPVTKSRLSQYGQVSLEGIGGLARHLGRRRPGPPVVNNYLTPAFVQEIDLVKQQSCSISAFDINLLLVAGQVNKRLFSQADLDGKAGSYTILRSERDLRRAVNRSGGLIPLVVHSDIGNGKTVFMWQIAYAFSIKGYSIYNISREPEDISEILRYFQMQNDKCLVLADDIWRFPKIISAIYRLKKNNIEILTTCRSATLETASHIVTKRLGTDRYSAIDLNGSDLSGLRRTVAYFEENGLLGEYTSFNPKEKEMFFGKTCGGQLRDIILSLFETGQLHEKVSEIAEDIKSVDDRLQKLLILSALITIGGSQQYGDMYIMFDLSEYNGTVHDIREELKRHGLSELIKVDSAEAAFKSPALAEFVLRNMYNIEEVLDVAKSALFRLSDYYSDDFEFDQMSRSLLRVSLYGRIYRSDITSKMESFFDDLRVINIAKRDPLFLVQRSIATMNGGLFDISKKYVKAAYAMADNRPGYDTYQVDTHHAKLILSEILEKGIKSDIAPFEEAQRLLEGVLSRRPEDLYHPVSVMRIYTAIETKWARSMSPQFKASFASLLRRAATQVARFPENERRRFRTVPNILKGLQISAKKLDLSP